MTPLAAPEGIVLVLVGGKALQTQPHQRSSGLFGRGSAAGGFGASMKKGGRQKSSAKREEGDFLIGKAAVLETRRLCRPGFDFKKNLANFYIRMDFAF